MPPTCDCGAQLFACLAGSMFFSSKSAIHAFTRPPWFSFPPSSSTRAINLSKSCSEIYGRQSHSITMSIFFLLFVFLVCLLLSLSLCSALSFSLVFVVFAFVFSRHINDRLFQSKGVVVFIFFFIFQTVFWFLFSFMQLRTIDGWYNERQSRKKTDQTLNAWCIPFLSR